MLTLSILADVLKVRLTGRDATFTGVSTDTRTLKTGDLFIALVGPRFDGHHFLAEAIAAGAAGALLSRPMDTGLPYVQVEDTRRALGELANFWRKQFDIPLVAVTGSNGKTTVKEMIAAILANRGAVCATRGNLNNDIGMPLTLLRLTAQDRFAVIEMGMNHKGEIDYLTRLAHPTVAAITNAGMAHLEALGSVEAIANAKGEIFAGLTEDGVAVINGDDPYCGLWKTLAAPRRVVLFGLERRPDVTAEYQLGPRGTDLRIKTPSGDVELTLPLLGRHNVMNALAATACALAVGATLEDVRCGLAAVQPAPGRLQMKEGVSGARVVDDSYNANPSSLSASLQVLTEFRGERVLALGDMGELGDEAPALHERMGRLAKELGIQRLFALGTLAGRAAETFGKGGRTFDSAQALIEALLDCMHGDMTVLVKGSRAARMEQVVTGIVRRTDAGGSHGPATHDNGRGLFGASATMTKGA